MSFTLIIDDLFLHTADKYFRAVYDEVYGEKVRGPLDLQALSDAVEGYLGMQVAACHVFFLEDRPSRFLRRHLEALALEHYRRSGRDASLIDALGPPDVVEFVLLDTGADLSDLLAHSPGPKLHPSEFVAFEALEFATRAENPMLMADDPAYALAELPRQTVLLRLGSEATQMPRHLRWQNICDLICHAYGVEP